MLAEKMKVADAKAELEATVEKLTEKQKALTVEVADAKVRHETDAAAIVALKKDVSDAKAIADAEVIERCSIIAKAEVVLGDVDKTLSALEIKKLVVEKRYPDIALADQSAAFVDGLFASVKQENTEMADAYAKSLNHTEAPTVSKADEARQKYINLRSK